MYEFPFDFKMESKAPDGFCTAVGTFKNHPYRKYFTKIT